MNNSRLRKIEKQYDAERDLIPGGPAVTWAEMELAWTLDDLIDEVHKLKDQVKALETRLASLNQHLELACTCGMGAQASPSQHYESCDLYAPEAM